MPETKLSGETPDLDKARKKADSLIDMNVFERDPNVSWRDLLAQLILEQRAEEAERCALRSLGREKDTFKARAADLRRQAGGEK